MPVGSAPEYGIVVERDVMVPMRDGIRLVTDIYRPAEDGEPLRGPLPTILGRTSYDKTWRRLWVEPVANYFAPRGFVVVLQDLRGRHGSEGTGQYFHTANVHEGEDGYDAIEWAIDVSLRVSSSAVDTDFTAKLLDVYPSSEDYPDGYHLNLADSIIRARYRNGFDSADMMEPGEAYTVRIALPPISNLFKAGHVIRLDVSSSNFPRFDVNPNTGEPMGRHTRMVETHNTVYLDRARLSHVVLPVVPPR